MAVRVQRILVCDFGERHAGAVRTYRITIDGSTTTLELCPKCARPIHKLLERAGKESTEAGKMRIYSMDEVEARTRKEPPDAT